MPAVVTVSRLSKEFGHTRALSEVSLTIEAGEMVALIGASGSGKSTLLRHIAGLARADATSPSSVEVLGRLVQRNGQLVRDIRAVRAGIGFIFQQFNLVGRLPVLTNVLVGMLDRVPAWRALLRQFEPREIREGLEALARVGMVERALQRASTLSGGQQQRAAIARALVQRAPVILADEPIASLDPRSATRVMDLMASINREDGTTILVSLHQIESALTYCPRAIALAHGRVVFDGPSQALTADKLHSLYGEDAAELLGEPVPPRDRASQPHVLPDGDDVTAGVVSLSRTY